MAVSVRAAYSMPHLYHPDFDLSPNFDLSQKSRYSRETRWGSSSPVLILSLLEIVEQDSVHMQEAAPRLKPGWVRNACAAFEQGTAPSPTEDQSNPAVFSKKDVDNEEAEEPVSPRVPRPSLDSRTPRCKQSSPKVRLSKAKSLDCLLTSGKTSSGKSRVPTPKELQRNASFSTSSKLPQKENLKEIRRRLKSPGDRNRSRPKPSVSARIPEALTGVGGGPIPLDNARRLCGGCLNEEAKNKIPGPLSKGSGDADGPSITQLKLREPTASLVITADRSSKHAALVQPMSSLSSPESPASIVGSCEDPFSVSSQHSPLQGSVSGSNETDQGLDIPPKSNLNITPPDNFGASGSQVDGEHGDIISSDMLTAKVMGNVCLETNDNEPSVRPKTESQDLFTDTIERIGRGSFNSCVIRANNRTILVSVRSCSVDGAKPAAENIPEEGGDDIDQSAIDNSVIAHHVTGGAYSYRNVALPCSERERRTEDRPDNCAVTIADKFEFPLEKLELFLHVRDVFKLGSSLKWENFQVYFNSHRDLSIPRPRFSNGCTLSLEGFEGLRDNSSDGHIDELKEALARKWSRSNEVIEWRKAFLSEMRLGVFRYQLLTHPLVYFDPLDVIEDGSDTEDGEVDDGRFTYFSLIPTYIIATIFSYLGTRDLAALKCTCVDFHWLINQFDITGRDCQWNSGEEYRNDPCMHCGKIRDPRGDVSLCRRHTKMYYSYSHIGRRYWTCCNAVDRRATGCQVGLHNNRWTTSQFEPNFICKPWKSRAWFVTANHELWCDKEHL